MPELPEVEVTRRSFADRIAGARVESVRVGKPLRWPLGCDPATLAGRTVRGVRRRGKYLLIDLDQGLLLLHLGMSGSLRFDARMPQAALHDHFDLVTSRGVLRLNDPRRFGAAVYCAGESSPEAVKLLGGLGVEPLGDAFELAAFHAALRKRKAAIKQVLLAGDVVVGVGNIYASEARASAGPGRRVYKPPSGRSWPAPWKKAAAHCAISPMPTARRATSSWRPWCTTVRGNPAGFAAIPSA